MEIHNFYRKFSPFFRRRRLLHFIKVIKPSAEEKILNVGGYHWFWDDIDHDLNITFLNLDSDRSSPRYVYVHGDGRSMPFSDNEFDIVFSNSVIEHLGSKEDQAMMAEEIMRVGSKYWVQTPAYEFFLSHTMSLPLFTGYLNVMREY